MAYPFHDHWLTETLRLRESLWGPLDDTAEVSRARAQGGTLEARLFTRSRLLAQREGLAANLQRWQHVAKLVLLLFSVLAVMTGGALAAGALGDGSRPVNLTLAVAALLGLHTLAFASWLLSFVVQSGATGSLLGNAWLRLTRRLARGPDAALLPRALLELSARNRLTRWGAGALSHWLWSLALLTAFLALLALLAARRYVFQWETTVLSPDTFVTLAHALGWLPSLLGFPLPPAETIRASGGQITLPDAAQALWSGWLLGIVAVYGVLPRIAALVLSVVVIRRRVARLALDASLPGIAELHDRLMPASVATGIDAPAPGREPAQMPTQARPVNVSSSKLLGVELPADLIWPPGEPASGVQDLGIVDTREQRRQVLETLHQTGAQRLLACCDARQTPDRGVLALLTEFAALADDFRVVLLPDDDSPARRRQWREQLMHAGLPPEHVLPGMAQAWAWLADHTERSPTR